ncbi:glycosyl transferase family 4 [Kibdelosporangium aridum]|uniref:Glycosyl transferase family 4 n=1 Tax=Kibdelosporangium aridum TaxID=2030 RepID=A0A428Z4M8_KIBAR|nr:GT4 family glycosyltransferase PelF [Kibdelosporangium aridum]RSM81587.1 glycosyl transferase family 4 [Kibdelosporangium aridum]
MTIYETESTFPLGAEPTVRLDSNTLADDRTVRISIPQQPQRQPQQQPQRRPVRPLRIALVSEGTYPYHPGGVSLWCDQLVKGMPESPFTVVALTVDGRESISWPRPQNLAEIVNMPLWSPRPRVPHRPPLTTNGPVKEAHRRFLNGIVRADEPGSVDEFIAGLYGMFTWGQVGDLRSALIANDALERLQWAYARVAPPGTGALTLHDALVISDLFEHMVRPLSYPPIRADVVHLAMNGISALVAFASKWAYGTPIVMSEHGVYLRERYLGVDDSWPYAVRLLMLRFHRALAQAAYRLVDVLAPHSEYNRRWQMYNGGTPDRIRTMYNGINPNDFPPAQGEPAVPTVVFVGRIDPLKDLHTLIRAFALVRAEIPAARLRMFGPVPNGNEAYHKSCLDLIDELGLHGSAVFEGRVPRQVDAYHAGHVTALTSVSEGFPYTVVESMATGRPQVCTNVGGVAEAVGDAGFVVPPRDHAAVAAACVKLLQDSELRRRAGQIARQRVLERFTLDQWNLAYRAIYDDLVMKRGVMR